MRAYQDKQNDNSVSVLKGSTDAKSRKRRTPSLKGLSKRKDVVLKSLLRKIRRFHWTQFKKTTSFGVKQKISIEHQRLLLIKYIEHEFGMESNEEFLDTLDKVLLMREIRNRTANIYNDLLHSYNRRKLQICMNDPYFKCLVFHYSFEVNPDEINKDEEEGLKMILKL
ncbi:unnamed protein product [Moneuplotes crassus]|uniref:Uncharacterized protein n=1 Tax=Euplotes crassus TaxID=5936 RepID=A0AAD1UC76_EUPCR|nr:unnamed protein product [Moneuplotes crassus]